MAWLFLWLCAHSAFADNPIALENTLPGNPPSEWDVTGAGDASIQGYAADISYAPGEVVQFKIDTSSANYRADIYRLGWYAGAGARKVASVQPFASLPQSQPACLTDAASGLVDCGNWAVSATWTIPANQPSGVYLAKLVREDPEDGRASHVVFVVRDDTGGSDLLFQTPDTTWQAYNDYGGNSLYTGSPAGRAYKVSYNRPFTTRGNQYRRTWLFDGTYPMIRFLEANGYDVSYISGVDSDRSGQLLTGRAAFLSVGHDEYWSATQRANVEAARDVGVNLAFFSGNEVFWKTRWEPSIDVSNTAHRTLVSYKETLASAKIDPAVNVWTGTWRDARFSPPADGGRPENSLTGTIFHVNCCREDVINVPAAYSSLRFWRNTSVALLGSGQTATLNPGVLGYEWDEAPDNQFAPPGLVRLSSTTLSVGSYLLDNGATYGPGTATHSLTLHKRPSGALVFGAGSTRWSWGLDGTHDYDSATPGASTTPDPVVQQATVNLLADMGAQPLTLQSPLVPASASTDTSPPASLIASPVSGASVSQGSPGVISGTAVDSGGGVVAAVEISVDGGTSWQSATGGATWSRAWTPSNAGTVTIKVRATDDSANTGPESSVTVTVTPQSCPCSLWSAAQVPAVASAADTAPVSLGLKFQSDVAGTITGVRFYKGPGNTGTHVGSLWTADGTLLSSVTFTGETALGWQRADFPSPVPIAANTTYVVAYHAPNGGYAYNSAYFASNGVDSGVLHAPSTAAAGGNGVYIYGPVTAFPTQTFNAFNYWVDVAWLLLPDTDADGVTDTQDNCSAVHNPTQCDSDNDGYGNRCDGDLNNNGDTNAQDTTLYRQQLGQPSVAPTYNVADINCSGSVNAQDTTLFRQLLGSPPGPSGLVP